MAAIHAVTPMLDAGEVQTGKPQRSSAPERVYENRRDDTPQKIDEIGGKILFLTPWNTYRGSGSPEDFTNAKGEALLPA